MSVRRRHGIALFAALGFMALIALLVAGSVTSSLVAQRSSRLALADAELTAAADYALATVLADPVGFGLAELPLGRATNVVGAASPGLYQVTIDVTRLRAGVLWLTADASLSGVDESHRRLNVVARFPSLAAMPAAGIVARGDVRLDAVAFAADTTSADAECVAVGPDVAVSPGAVVRASDSIRVEQRPAAGDTATYFLLARQLAALDSSGRVYHVHGDTVIAGGSLVGILVADGSVTISGPYAVTGLVIARGRVESPNGGLVITGALLAFGAPADGSVAVRLSGAVVRYSPCAVAHALRLALPPHPVRQRSWAELF